MSLELKFIWNVSGKTTFKAKVYAPDGTRRENPDIALTEIGATGIYVGSSPNIVAGDLVAVYDNDDPTENIGSGEYMPEVTASGISSDLSDITDTLDTIQTDIEALTVSTGKTLVQFDLRPKKPKVRIIENL